MHFKHVVLNKFYIFLYGSELIIVATQRDERRSHRSENNFESRDKLRLNKNTVNKMPKTHRRVQQNIPNIKITQNRVAKLLRNINPSKASGPDNIPNRVLKQCADHLPPSLTIIFQCSIDHSKLPHDAKRKCILYIQERG